MNLEKVRDKVTRIIIPWFVFYYIIQELIWWLGSPFTGRHFGFFDGLLVFTVNPLTEREGYLAAIFQVSYVISGILAFFIVRRKSMQETLLRVFHAISPSLRASESEIQADAEITGSAAL